MTAYTFVYFFYIWNITASIILQMTESPCIDKHDATHAQPQNLHVTLPEDMPTPDTYVVTR